MSPVLISGITIVNLALICYSIAIIRQTRNKIIDKKVLTFLTLGVIFDISATICMVLGSSEGAITVHGIIGYSSLAGMLTDTIFTYRNSMKRGLYMNLSKSFIRNSLIAYLYWIAAYITGAIIIMSRHS